MNKYPVEHPESFAWNELHFEPVEWSSYMDLSSGVCLLLETDTATFIFQCTTDQDGGKCGNGSLYEYDSERRLVASNHDCSVNLRHPIPFLDQKNVPSVEFHVRDAETDKLTRIIPPSKELKRAFHEGLHEEFTRRRAEEVELSPFLTIGVSAALELLQSRPEFDEATIGGNALRQLLEKINSYRADT